MRKKVIYQCYFKQLEENEAPYAEARMMAVIVAWEEGQPEAEVVTCKLVKDTDEGKIYFQEYLKEHAPDASQNLVGIYRKEDSNG